MIDCQWSPITFKWSHFNWLPRPDLRAQVKEIVYDRVHERVSGLTHEHVAADGWVLVAFISHGIGSRAVDRFGGQEARRGHATNGAVQLVAVGGRLCMRTVVLVEEGHDLQVLSGCVEQQGIHSSVQFESRAGYLVLG